MTCSGDSSKYVIVFALITFAVDTRLAIADESCRTPDKSAGSCILIYNCTSVMEFLDKVQQPITPEIRKFLRSYSCGVIGDEPKVCCPEEPIVVPEINNYQKEEPPNISNHRNLHLLPENCGLINTDNRIVNGNKTGLFEFPWMALLSYKTPLGSSFSCGGTIINERYILTAAHCIDSDALLEVRVGEHDISKPIDCETPKDGAKYCAPPYQDLPIEKSIAHPQYNPKTGTNDIGLLRVAKSINFTLENMKPVCLPLDKTRNYNFTGRNVVVTGWGVTENGTSSPDLLKAELPIIPTEECQKFYIKVAKISNYRQLCAGGTTNSDSCAGDSGGPLHVVAKLYDDQRLIQQGVVSFGPKDCGNSGLPGIYTKVAYYMDWILDNIKP